MRRAAHTSWGGIVARRSGSVGAREWCAAPSPGPVLAYGNGRSYGDSCLIDDGTFLDTSELDRIVSLDADIGLVVCEAGVMLGNLLETCVPRGWFVPVTPGTRFVTMAGAVANDVHGKNHHALGTIGRHIAWLDLVRSDGQMLRCSRTRNGALFKATIGGMGLTGLITRLALQLVPIKGPFMSQDTLPFAGLDGFFDIATQSDATHDYTVAWIDSLATGAGLGRGVFFRANHSGKPGSEAAHAAKPLPLLPFMPPVPLLNRLTLRVFNAATALSTVGQRPA